MQIRKAIMQDVKEIQNLINYYAKSGDMLPRSFSSIIENIRDFWVCEENGKIAGTCALSVVWEDLAEIRSLAVRKDRLGMGIGKALVLECINEAKSLGIKKVFTLTYKVEFFKKLGFKIIDKKDLPQKIWKDCINCIKFPVCDEIAMEINLEKV